MKLFIKNQKSLLIMLLLTAICFMSLFIPIHLPGNPLSYRKEGGDIVFRYEIFGCGSLIRKMEKGGEAIYKIANLSEPDSGVYEIQFTPDSDEPEKHIDSAEFYTGGIAGKYTYYMRIEVVGIERGAPECCDPQPAYNEAVPLVRVLKWEPTTFTPEIYFTMRHYITLLMLPFLLIADSIILINSVYTYGAKRFRKQFPNDEIPRD